MFEAQEPEHAPGGELIFSGRFRGTVVEGRDFHAKAVADKTRHRSRKGDRKKATSGASRKTLHPSRSTARTVVTKPKSSRRTKPSKGVSRGMMKNKKTAPRTVERVA